MSVTLSPVVGGGSRPGFEDLLSVITQQLLIAHQQELHSHQQEVGRLREERARMQIEIEHLRGVVQEMEIAAQRAKTAQTPQVRFADQQQAPDDTAGEEVVDMEPAYLHAVLQAWLERNPLRVDFEPELSPSGAAYPHRYRVGDLSLVFRGAHSAKGSPKLHVSADNGRTWMQLRSLVEAAGWVGDSSESSPRPVKHDAQPPAQPAQAAKRSSSPRSASERLVASSLATRGGDPWVSQGSDSRSNPETSADRLVGSTGLARRPIPQENSANSEDRGTQIAEARRMRLSANNLPAFPAAPSPGDDSYYSKFQMPAPARS
mmetsp:Transcript_42554/g.112227  ORF Transcript_42554/g.112227 Transcript_42554/m.112227 type:complete len:318 (+) Transcript_42554:40-993(+)